MKYKDYQPSIPYNLLNRRGTYYRVSDKLDENGLREKVKVSVRDFYYKSTENTIRENNSADVQELGVAYCRGNIDDGFLPINGYIEWEDGEINEIYKAKREVNPTVERTINHTKIYLR